MAVGTRCADHVTPFYPQKLALTSPTGGGRSVGIVRSRTKATELLFMLSFHVVLGKSCSCSYWTVEYSNGNSNGVLLLCFLFHSFVFVPVKIRRFEVQNVYCGHCISNTDNINKTIYFDTTGCPTRYRTRHFFNNSNTNEDIATKFEQEYVRCVRNVTTS